MVELLVVLAISAVVLGMLTTGVIHALQAQRRQVAQMQAITQAQLGFERVTRDIRAADPLYVAEPDRIRLATRTPGGPRMVTYRHVDGALVVEEGAVSTSRRLVEHLVHVDEPLFRFHLTDGTTVSGAAVDDPRWVRSITVRLRVRPPEAGEVVRLDNRVLLRNQQD